MKDRCAIGINCCCLVALKTPIEIGVALGAVVAIVVMGGRALIPEVSARMYETAPPNRSRR